MKKAKRRGTAEPKYNPIEAIRYAIQFTHDKGLIPYEDLIKIKRYLFKKGLRIKW